MPLIKQQFKVDMFNLRYARDPEGLRQSHKDEAARALGAKLIEAIPYQLEEKFEGELPAATLTKDHHFTETWGVEFVVFTRKEIDDLKHEIEYNNPGMVVEMLRDLLNK